MFAPLRGYAETQKPRAAMSGGSAMSRHAAYSSADDMMLSASPIAASAVSAK